MTAATGTLVWKGPFFHSGYMIAIVTFSDLADTNTFAVDGGTPDLNFSSVVMVWEACNTDPADKVGSCSHDGSTITFQAEATFPTTNTTHLFIVGVPKAA